MLRRAPLKRTAFKAKPPRHEPAAEREPKPLAKATRRGVISRCDTAAEPQPKDPHTVNPHLRNLARGEACTGLLYGIYCNCDPATTVWAHSNAIGDGKGMGYKSSDHMGAFLGYECHQFLDQGKGSAEEKARFFAGAQLRTRDRLAEIAADPMARPWKRQAAKWALEQLKEKA